MKNTLLLTAGLLISSPSFSNDAYSHMVYTASSFMYWCEFKQVPESVDDLAKVTDMNEINPQLTITPEKWLSSVRLIVKGEELQVTRKTENGKSTSTSNCGSFEIESSQSNKSLKPTTNLSSE